MEEKYKELTPKIELSKPDAPVRLLSVGEEFIAWAETYWRLDKLFDGTAKNPSEKGGEFCSYDVVKPIFLKKINDLILKRILP